MTAITSTSPLPPREPELCPHQEDHIRVHRSWRSVLPQLGFALVATSLVVALAVVTEYYGVPITLSERTFILPLAPLIFAVLTLRPLIILKDCHHELRCTELRSVSGRFSKERIQVDIPYEDVKGVRVRQTITQQLLNVGDILAWTAVAERPEVTMKGVGNPSYYSNLITHRAHLAQVHVAQAQVVRDSAVVRNSAAEQNNNTP